MIMLGDPENPDPNAPQPEQPQPEQPQEPWPGYPDAAPPADMQGSEPGRVKLPDGSEVLQKEANQGPDTTDTTGVGEVSQNAPREDVAREQGGQDPTQEEWLEISKEYDTAIYKEGMEAARAGRDREKSNRYREDFPVQRESFFAGYDR
jgi:hypothetical protein